MEEIFGGRRRMDNINFPPNVLSDEEIEMYLKGDRREIDRLILYSINRLTACIVPHAQREEQRDHEVEGVIKSLGGIEAIERRAIFVDSLIKHAQAKTAMMERVSQSTITWALIAFLGLIAIASWDAIIHTIKAKLGG